jgi:hypothetical protein
MIKILKLQGILKIPLKEITPFRLTNYRKLLIMELSQKEK